MPTTVLFADPDHGPRAQMAAAVLRSADGGGRFSVSSAGSAPGGDLAGVAEALAERGVGFVAESQALDVSMAPDLLIVVCEEGCAACPYLPRATRIFRWPFDDPAGLHGGRRARALRDIAGRLKRLSSELVDARLDSSRGSSGTGPSPGHVSWRGAADRILGLILRHGARPRA